MPTLTEQRAAVSKLRYERQLDFERDEHERRRRDEITDQSERLAAPMENTFEYELTPDGLRSDLGEYLIAVLEEGYKVAAHQAVHDPNWIFEQERRGIEIEELQEATAFARSYGCGVRITSLSLDRSNYIGMRAIAAHLGHDLPAERPGSEEILRTRMRTDVPPALVVQSPIPDAVRLHNINIGGYDAGRDRMLVRIVTPLSLGLGEHTSLLGRIRNAYDESLSQQLGGDWFAGRRPRTVQNSRLFIEDPAQADLLDAHMVIVDDIFSLTTDKFERNELLAPHRYNLAAALSDRMDGKTVTSLSDAGDAARAEGKSFDGDCPTTNSTAAQQAERLGFGVEPRHSILKCVNCPYCKRTVDAKKVNTVFEKSIQCLSCHKKVDLRTGKVMGEDAAVPKQLGRAAARTMVKTIPFPPHLQRKEILSVGGVRVEYRDLRKNTATRRKTS